jgi:ABC-type lipoprotein export system ATPase subunit
MDNYRRSPEVPDIYRSLLQLIEISKDYAASDDAPVTPVLRAVNLTVEDGESLSIVGPSGSGKSTLLNIIGTLDRPTSGQILLSSRDLSTLNDRELARIRATDIGFVFQLHHLLPQCTVMENVLVPTLAGGLPKHVEPPADRAKRLLDRVGLSDRLNHRPGQLSGGERQRVAVVRALINEPRLLLADEPTGALDRSSADNMADLLVELNREEKVALIVITHAVDLAQRMGRVLGLEDGTLVPHSVAA